MNQLRLIRSSQGAQNPGGIPKTLTGLLNEPPPPENTGRPEPGSTQSISVRLRTQGENGIIAYRGKKNTPLIDLSREGHYNPAIYWDAIPDEGSGRLILDPGEFYILGSREALRVPPGCSAEMVAFNPAMGEFRVHYAGFFDPGFGLESPVGTPAVLGGPFPRNGHRAVRRPADRRNPVRPDERAPDQDVRDRHGLILRATGTDPGQTVQHERLDAQGGLKPTPGGKA